MQLKMSEAAAQRFVPELPGPDPTAEKVILPRPGRSRRRVAACGDDDPQVAVLTRLKSAAPGSSERAEPPTIGYRIEAEGRQKTRCIDPPQAADAAVSPQRRSRINAVQKRSAAKAGTGPAVIFHPLDGELPVGGKSD